ncbi:MAG TPA: PAS domain-containing protein [Gemmatimonadales bacterium]|nr:PAS domain-containing protein [Gemmatimonadales bacterium]
MLARTTRWVLYGMAVVCVAAAIALPAAIEPIVGSQSSLITLLIFSLAVGFASTAGGVAPGSAALLLGAMWFLLVGRHYSPGVSDTGAVVLLGVYALSAGGIALLATSRRFVGADLGALDESTEFQNERRNLAELPRGAGERYRTPPDEANDSAIYMLNPEGRVATWNKGIGRMLGYDRLEFLHADAADLYTPEDRAQGLPDRELAEAAEKGRVSTQRWVVRKDGTWLPVQVTVTSVRNAEGNLLGFAHRLRDLSEVKRIEEELLRHQEALELGYEAAGLGAWDHNLLTGELRLDQRATLMLGFHPGDPVSYANWADAIHPEDQGPTEELRQAAIVDRQPFSAQFRVLWPDGTTHWIAAIGRGTYQKESGRPLRMRGILLDVTERKQTEERLQEVVRLEAIGRLAGGIAHDLNNMLVAIMGFSDLLAQTFTPDDPRREDVDQINRAATQSANLTQQLLAFARRELIRPRQMDLNRVVRYAAGMLRPVVGENIELDVKLSPTLGGIHADPPRVEQIVMNLVLNARDAMPRGGRVEVETAPVELQSNSPAWQPEGEAPPPGRYAVLSVRDTGHGMDPETLQHIWEPFFTTKPAGQGTGLGLSVVYGSVKQSGGFVWAESEVGRGTTIRVYWPEIPVVSEHTGEIAVPAPVQRGTETVLVVEDEPVVRALIVRTVKGFGYSCLEAHDATEALRLLEQEQGKFDLVITDVVMPGMSGGQLGELLAHQYPTLPVLYTSGFANNDIIRRGLLDASRPFLQKPFTPDDLARKIRDVLEASTARDYEAQSA